MELVGLDYADIRIDADGQPIASDNGDFSVVLGYRMLAAGYPKRNGYSRR
ncbi:MAG: hypothetical protein ACLSHV_03985 [Hominisplanchenecus sp.]